MSYTFGLRDDAALAERVNEGISETTTDKDNRLSLDVVEKMLEFYCLGLPNTEIARRLHISQTTVAKYISDGDPSRGVVPLLERRGDIMRRIQDDRNAEVISKIARLLASSVDVAEQAGSVVVDRLGAYRKLYESKLAGESLDTGVSATLEDMAIKPDSEDYERFVRASSKVVEAVARASGLGSTPTTSVNVNAVSGASSESGATMDSLVVSDNSGILGHLARLREAQSDQTFVQMSENIVKAIECQDEGSNESTDTDKGNG